MDISRSSFQPIFTDDMRLINLESYFPLGLFILYAVLLLLPISFTRFYSYFFLFFSYIYIYISLLFVLVWIFSKLENLDRRATRLGKLNLVRRWWNGIQLLVIRPGHDWKRMIESPKEREMTRGMGGWIIGMERWMRTDENSSCKINRGLNYWFSSN